MSGDEGRKKPCGEGAGSLWRLSWAVWRSIRSASQAAALWQVGGAGRAEQAAVQAATADGVTCDGDAGYRQTDTAGGGGGRRAGDGPAGAG